MQKNDLKYYGLGCVLSTFLFLSLISFVGSITKQVISTAVIHFLNLIVGFMLIYFGLRNLILKENLENPVFKRLSRF